MLNRAQKFQAVVTAVGSRVHVPVPFDPNEGWGRKQRHHVTGTIDGAAWRGPLEADGDRYYLTLGAAWRRDAKISAGAAVTVVLSPEGPQAEDLDADIAAALAAEPEAQAFFASLATFYRKGYLKWVAGARRPEARAARIAELVTLLKAGRKSR